MDQRKPLYAGVAAGGGGAGAQRGGATGSYREGGPRRNMLFLWPFAMLNSPNEFGPLYSDYAQLCPVMLSTFPKTPRVKCRKIPKKFRMYPENGRNPYYAEVMPASSAWPYVKDLEVLSALHDGRGLRSSTLQLNLRAF